ncbi:Sporulation related domain-containing protein [Streptomyces sp. WMMB 714]|uniref:SPOR domain-containing protein n=1 Tax=Streptomyces sp. WMMB 714 TaxID=1286822 RepID=UPI000823A0B0|nr:SPOR domain-containing protein [Streptomyces sp. WMMB 714]SCK13613.1 Sporulation related domain-containing protein [Streptomyces sp. WMMB 714]
MRRVSADGEAVLPWHVIREDGDGHRYRVGGYSTRTEAQRVADRLSGRGERAAGEGPVEGKGSGRYLVEPVTCASGEYA